jgi:hypothetical protein
MPSMPDMPSDTPPWRRPFTRRWWAGLYDRLLHRFGLRTDEAATEPPAPPPLRFPDRLDVHQPSHTFTLTTPAKGDAFDFEVRIRCEWCVETTATEEERERKTEEVERFIADSRTSIGERVEEAIRPIARRFPPYRPAEAEAAIREGLVGCFKDGDVQCRVRAWVDLSEPVRDDLRKVWQRRLFQEADGEEKTLHVEILAGLQEEWRELLVSGLEGVGEIKRARTGWVAPYALALAEQPENAAGYLKAMLEHRVGHAEQLLNQLGDLVMHHNQIEDIEFAFRSDSALRAVLTHLGVPVRTPAEDPDMAEGFLGDDDE